MKQKAKRVLYVGQAYYNHWYLSRELRKLGWGADLINIDTNKDNQAFYHGEDYSLAEERFKRPEAVIKFYLDALYKYDIFHFANMEGMIFVSYFDGLQKKRNILAFKFWGLLLSFLFNKLIRWRLVYIYKFTHLIGMKNTVRLMKYFSDYLPVRWDILLIKKMGKKIAYTNNGCHDGVSKTNVGKIDTEVNESICTICPHNDVYEACNDEKNLAWGKFRNKYADIQFLIDGNRSDYNISEKILEMPENYCLDKNIWSDNLLVPSNYKLPIKEGVVKLYHAVGNYDKRSIGVKTVKSTHIYIPLIEKLKNENYNVELVFINDVPNKKVRYYQAQADVILDMLTYGGFGANIREGLMLGKPCICYLKQEWLDQMSAERPEYVAELPIINANPKTIESILKDLIDNPAKRIEIGRKSREFALKWHASDIAAIKMAQIYESLW